MRYLFFIAVLALACCTRKGRTGHGPEEKTSYFTLGDTRIRLGTVRYSAGNNLFFVHLHDNEYTAGEAALQVLQSHGGSYVRLHNGGERLVSFRYNGESYRFDPNRIFTPAGREASLRKHGSYHPEAAKALEGLARFILSLIPSRSIVIALHNNTDGAYSIGQYRSGPLQADAAAVYLAPGTDPDDFIFTTDAQLYRRLSGRGHNLVLQQNNAVTDDGSLSVYFGRLSRTYVNIEAEFGHGPEQVKMTRSILGSLAD